MFAPVLYLLHAHGDSTKSLRLSSLVPFAIRTYFVSSVRKSALPHRGQSDGARDKVCHPELVSGSKLSAKHTSPFPLLSRRGYSSLSKSRLLKDFESFLIIIVRSTVTDYSLFTIHTSVSFAKHHVCCLPIKNDHLKGRKGK